MKKTFPGIAKIICEICVICVSLTCLNVKPAISAGPQTQPVTQDSLLEERVKALSKHLRCPVCQGLSIQDSPSDLSIQMKGVVRDMVHAGKTDDEIKDYFVSKYGEWILLEPKPAGMNLAVYLAPFVLLIVGGGIIVVMVRKWTRQGGQADATASP